MLFPTGRTSCIIRMGVSCCRSVGRNGMARGRNGRRRPRRGTAQRAGAFRCVRFSAGPRRCRTYGNPQNSVFGMLRTATHNRFVLTNARSKCARTLPAMTVGERASSLEFINSLLDARGTLPAVGTATMQRYLGGSRTRICEPRK